MDNDDNNYDDYFDNRYENDENDYESNDGNYRIMIVIIIIIIMILILIMIMACYVKEFYEGNDENIDDKNTSDINVN